MKTLGKPKRGGRTRTRAEASKHASGVMVVSETLEVGSWFCPGEYEAMLQDTLGHWVLWSAPSTQSSVAGLPSSR